MARQRPRLDYVFERFSAHDHAASANGARRNAALKAQYFLRAIWRNRWKNLPNLPGIPFVCGAAYRARNLDLINIKCEIHDAICGLKRQQNRPMDRPDTALVYMTTRGQTSACNSTTILSHDYKVETCSAAARQAVCGPLGDTFD